MDVKFYKSLEKPKVTSLNFISKVNYKDEADTREVLKSSDIKYEISIGEISTYGIVELEIPVIFWLKAMKFVIYNYEYKIKGRWRRSFPKKLMPKQPELKGIKEIKRYIEALQGILVKEEIEVGLNSSTFKTHGSEFSSKIASAVGEMVCCLVWQDNLKEVNLENGLCDYDLRVGEYTVDVKTKLRMRTFTEYHYQATVPNYQIKKLKCDYYANLNIPSWDKVQIIGLVKKDYAEQNAIYYAVGTPMWNKMGEPYKSDTYSLTYCEMPNWLNADDIFNFITTANDKPIKKNGKLLK